MLFDSVWEWFEKYGWPIRYKLKTPDIIKFLLSRGVTHIVALHYAHRPGIAEKLNRYMAEVCRLCPAVTGLATVFPGEAGAGDILSDGIRPRSFGCLSFIPMFSASTWRAELCRKLTRPALNTTSRLLCT